MRSPALECIDQYACEVGRCLPRALRSDVRLELTSLLADSLEERCRGDATVRAVDHATDLLVEIGPPHELAASYVADSRSARVPGLRGAMWLTLLVAGVGLAFTPGALEFALGGREDILRGFAAWDRGTWATFALYVLSVIGTIAAAFTGAHWLVVRGQAGRRWCPTDLGPSRRWLRVDYATLAASRAFLASLLVTLVFLVGIIQRPVLTQETSVEAVQYVSADARAMVPWIVGTLSLELVVGALLLYRSRWTLGSTALATTLGIGWMLLLGALVLADPLVVRTSLATNGAGSGISAVTSTAVLTLAPVVLVLLFVVAGIATFTRASRLTRIAVELVSALRIRRSTRAAHGERRVVRPLRPVRGAQ